MNRKYRAIRVWNQRNKKMPGVPSRRRGFSNINDEELYRCIKSDIVSLIDSEYSGSAVRTEGFANSYNVPIHRITEVFKQLNQDGLLSQKISIYRGAMNRGDPAWHASYYYSRGNTRRPTT